MSEGIYPYVSLRSSLGPLHQHLNNLLLPPRRKGHFAITEARQRVRHILGLILSDDVAAEDVEDYRKGTLVFLGQRRHMRGFHVAVSK